MPDEAAPRRLPVDYYLDHFLQVIAGLRARYQFLLSKAECRHLETLEALPRPALMLYARLVNRRGPCFRTAKLAYPEIPDIAGALAALRRAGLLQDCAETLPITLLSCFTLPELRAALPPHAAPKNLRKPELLAWAAGWDGLPACLAALLRAHPVVRIPETDPWPFLRFLFFGEPRDNLTDFVTRALGHIVPETIDAAHLRPHFKCRAQAEDAFRMSRLYEEFRQIRATSTALETFQWWQSQNIRRAALHAGHDRFDRVIDRLGRLLERDGERAAARELYQTGTAPPARERLARLLLKSGDRPAARALLEAMRDSPHDTEEAYIARQLLARLAAIRSSEARRLERQAETLILDYQDGAAEAAALAHFRAQGFAGVHSENWLWNACFGLLLWDIIYDPASGVFHSPLQLAPSDLHDPNFYPSRRAAIEARLALLTDRDAAWRLIAGHHDSKHGLANPFVAWHPALPDVLAIMLRNLPAAGLAAALRHLAQNIRLHASGLPDLFLWRGAEYRFVEVKAENDHLSPRQYEWLRILTDSGIQVTLQKLHRPRAKLAAVKQATSFCEQKEAKKLCLGAAGMFTGAAS
jgi:hypothetical protein